MSVSVIIDAAMLARLAAIGPADAFGRRCEFSDGSPIPVNTAERLICNGSVSETYTATSPEGIIDIAGITTPARTANRAQRRALAERDRGCAYPGCGAPVDWCDVHHLKPWRAGGRTKLSNLALLCRFHHHLVHEGGHTLARAPTGTITVTKPDGTTLSRPRPGRLLTEPPALPETTDLSPVSADHDAENADPTGRGEPEPRARGPSRYRPLTERITREERLLRSCHTEQAACIRGQPMTWTVIPYPTDNDGHAA